MNDTSPHHEATVRRFRAIISDITTERGRQDAKWGEQDHNFPKYYQILNEELGEASKAFLEKDFANLRVELIQCAAVLVAMLECGDRTGWFEREEPIDVDFVTQDNLEKMAKVFKAGCNAPRGPRTLDHFTTDSNGFKVKDATVHLDKDPRVGPKDRRNNNGRRERNMGTSLDERRTPEDPSKVGRRGLPTDRRKS